MPEHTENHDYQLFADSETDWEHRTDFEQLDVDVELRGPDGEKGSHNPKQGAMYVATDTGNRYLGDGSSWQAIPAPQDSPGAITDGDGTARQLWVIPAGAPDPSESNPEDFIFEEES